MSLIHLFVRKLRMLINLSMRKLLMLVTRVVLLLYSWLQLCITKLYKMRRNHQNVPVEHDGGIVETFCIIIDITMQSRLIQSYPTAEK